VGGVVRWGGWLGGGGGGGGLGVVGWGGFEGVVMSVLYGVGGCGCGVGCFWGFLGGFWRRLCLWGGVVAVGVFLGWCSGGVGVVLGLVVGRGGFGLLWVGGLEGVVVGWSLGFEVFVVYWLREWWFWVVLGYFCFWCVGFCFFGVKKRESGVCGGAWLCFG